MAHNVDDLLTQVPNKEVNQPIQNEPINPGPPLAAQKDDVLQDEKKLNYLDQFRKDKDELENKNNDVKEIKEQQKDNEQVDYLEEENQEGVPELDDYGIEAPKPRMYTEEEVQKKIRERLSRGKQPIQDIQPDQQPYTQNVNPKQSEGEQDWEKQLESFVENTVVKIDRKRQEENWRAKEQKAQADFEARFTTGMDRYGDFADVVSGKPITNAMMMASRGMKDPAAFIYAASKMQPKELERISQISDPSVQALEIGRLEERMRKAKRVSGAPKPSSKTTSDYSTQESPKLSVDALITADARRKLSRR